MDEIERAFEQVPHHQRLYYDSLTRELAKHGVILVKIEKEQP